MTEEIKLKRADSLPASIQKQYNIYDGIVEIKVVRNSPKKIESVKPATGLFSELFSKAGKKE